VPGVRAVRAGTVAAVREARATMDANVLVIEPDAPLDAVLEAVSAFVDEGFVPDADRVRRLVQVMEFETSGTIEGWQIRYGDAALDSTGRPPSAAPRAVVYDRRGDPSVLRTAHVEEVRPGPGEVRVAVRIAGLNPFDAKVRYGRIPLPEPTFPAGVGQDFAGTVDAVGEDARYTDGTPVAVGDNVLGWTESQGAARDQLLVDARQIARKPPRLEWALAGTLATAGLTARACLDLLRIGPDDVVLVSSAAGGVGSVYTQLALDRKAFVIGTAGPDNLGHVRSLGAVALPYGPHLARRVAEVLPGPLTAVQDNHGRDTAEAGLALGVPSKRVITIADHAAVEELGLSSPGRYRRSAATLAELADMAARG
ncbi:NADP-dependent oxidoreductase, partial [Streptomyces sp. NPDC006356]